MFEYYCHFLNAIFSTKIAMEKIKIVDFMFYAFKTFMTRLISSSSCINDPFCLCKYTKTCISNYLYF